MDTMTSINYFLKSINMLIFLMPTGYKGALSVVVLRLNSHHIFIIIDVDLEIHWCQWGSLRSEIFALKI